MFRLDSGDLPPTTRAIASSCPVCRVWHTSSHYMGAIATVNILANYQDGGAIVELPQAISAALIFRIDIGSIITDLNIPGYIEVDNPIYVNLANYWIDDTTINVFAYPQERGTELLITISIIFPAPVKNGDTYLLEVPSLFTATNASFSGVALEVLQQVETVVTISSPIDLKIGEPISVVGNMAIALNDPIAAALIFDLSDSGITYLDALDFMGKSFTPSVRALSSKIGEFFWDEDYRIANIILDKNTSIGFVAAPELRDGTNFKSIGTVSY